MGTAGTAGFTLVELLVAVTIGGILMGAIYQVLITNERVSAVQREQVQSQQTVRAGVDLLAQELREVSGTGGDLLAIAPDSVAFRALRTLGIACTSGSTNIDVATVGQPFSQMRDVYVLMPDPAGGSAQWEIGTMDDIPANSSCPDDSGRPAQRLVLSGLSANIPPGAIIRAFDTVSYHVAERNGDLYLVRTRTGGETAQLVGPLQPQEGLELTYLDGQGVETANVGDVRRVRITLRTRPGARTEQGREVADDLSTVVSLRN